MRSDVYAIGHRLSISYVIDVQNDAINLAGSRLVVPASPDGHLTTWRPRVLADGKIVTVYCERLSSVDLADMQAVDKLGPIEMDKIETALRLVLGLR